MLARKNVIWRNGRQLITNMEQGTEKTVVIERLDGTRENAYIEGNEVFLESETFKKTFHTKQECEKFCAFAALLGYEGFINKLDDMSIQVGADCTRVMKWLYLYRELADGLMFETNEKVESRIFDDSQKFIIKETLEKLTFLYKIFKEVSFIEEKVREYGYNITNFEESLNYLDEAKYVFVKLNAKTKNYYLVVGAENLHRAKERKTTFIINPVSSFERQKLIENIEILKEALEVNIWISKFHEDEQVKEGKVAETKVEKKADVTCTTEVKEEQVETSDSETEEDVHEDVILDEQKKEE